MLSLLEPTGDVMARSEIIVPFASPSSIPIVRGPDLKSGTMIIAGFMAAGILIPNHFEVPYYNFTTKIGYQRPPQESRINQLANDLRTNRVDLPTAVLLNIRNRDAKHYLQNGSMRLESLTEALASHLKFFVVDGQHRVLALKKLMNEDYEKWSKFMLPFVCMIGANEQEEMNQFYIVNSTAKSVRTDLALTILKTRADRDPDVYEALQERGREWQVDGQALVERMAVESAVWKDRIRLPAMEKSGTIIPSASMVASLKPLLSSPYFGRMKVDQQLQVLNSYWEGIREVLRPAFTSPEEYSIQKGVGVIVLHSIMPDVIELVRGRGWSVVDSDSYARIFDGAMDGLHGENSTGDPVQGLEFWRAAPLGAAGSYSSSAGRRVLIAKIRQVLPQIEVE